MASMPQMVGEYANALGKHGPMSPETDAIRNRYFDQAEFLAYADALDRIRRHLSKNKGQTLKTENDALRACIVALLDLCTEHLVSFKEPAIVEALRLLGCDEDTYSQ